MGKHSKILVAFDASVSSQNALRQAVALKKLENSWLKVLAVVPAYEGDLELIGVHDVEAVLRGPKERLLGAAQEIADAESTHITTNVEQGEAYEKIVEVAEREDCDLIVMGRRGLRRLERMLMGSVTARVIAHSSKDVLVVPQDAAVDLSSMLLATDGSAHSRAALGEALYFAQAFGGSLTALAVVDMYPEYYADAPEVVEKMEAKAVSALEECQRLGQEQGVKVETKLLHGDPADEITGFAQKQEIGVIFVGTRGRSGLKKLLIGSVAEKVIGLARCPVLVAKPATK